MNMRPDYAAVLCLAGGAVAMAVIYVVAVYGTETWGFSFAAIGMATMFLIGFGVEYADRRQKFTNQMKPTDRQESQTERHNR